MGIIRKTLWVIGSKGRRRVRVLFDTGSSLSMIRGNLAREIGGTEELPEPMTCHAAVGTFTARKWTVANVKIGRYQVLASLTVIPNLTEDVIVGADFLQRWHIKLDPFKRRIIVDPEDLILRA